MTLRSLLEKAAGEEDPVKQLHNKAAFLKALDKCADELLAVVEELENIVNAKRFSRDHFRDDTEYADWLQSRGRTALQRLKEKEAATCR